MNAPIFPVLSASAGVREIFGDPPRVSPFSEGLHAGPKPYATYQWAGGSPENYLADRPDVDNVSLQVDVYALDDVTLGKGVRAIRDAIELHCYITSWRGQTVDRDTGLLRFSFDCDWLASR
ncbi:DUF3168 domain-containing protein [Kerstersia gyiorum]|uniref:tail completion protein gp17 n=1 Tax=Kerstersia gyiorum TaxID=206506 RepID=UPI0010713623|nr:DUF3168 domain-containing protein [Kerstersia gyiorum]QBR40954.1 DUF3168 domain-containing protein [Kerstersia gyiorum]